MLRAAWANAKEFSGFSGGAGLLWPRWLLLRAIGLVFVLIFFDLLRDAPGLVGSTGVTPVTEFCAKVGALFPSGLERLLRAPSVFWLGTGDGLIQAVAWMGLAAAIGLVLNLCPRVMLALCWGALLSFVATWQGFSPTIIDQLMLEVALLAVPFAPGGLRPGLASGHPPLRMAVFALRWLLLRLMFVSGAIKLLGGDPHWLNFTALDVMYETSPSPTFLGFVDHQLPHAWHVIELGFTFVAELVAPFVAIVGGRRGRWFAFVCWTVFQLGIQLTGNFGWLNTAAIALGLLLLDDEMIRSVLRRWRREVAAPVATGTTVPVRWPRVRVAVSVLLALHVAVTIHATWQVARGRAIPPAPAWRDYPVDYLLRDFRSANGYVPFANFPVEKAEIEFLGTNDRGVTWRPYPFRCKPQEETRISPFLAPRFARFDASLQLALAQNPFIVPRVAEQLLRQNPAVRRLFADDPFPDAAPQAIRMAVSRYRFNDWATWRQTGKFWRKEYAGDLAPALILDPDGTIRPDRAPGQR